MDVTSVVLLILTAPEIGGSAIRIKPELSSCALHPDLMPPADQGTVLHAEERTRAEVDLRGLADLVRGDPRDPLGPVPWLVEAQVQALQLEQSIGPLLDGLKVKDIVPAR